MRVGAGTGAVASRAARAAALRVDARARGSPPRRPVRSRANFDEHSAKIDAGRMPPGLPRRVYWCGGRYYVTGGGGCLGRFRLLQDAVRARDAFEAAGGDMRGVAAGVLGSGAAGTAARRPDAADGAGGAATAAPPAAKRRRLSRVALLDAVPAKVTTRALAARRARAAAADGLGAPARRPAAPREATRARRACAADDDTAAAAGDGGGGGEAAAGADSKEITPDMAALLREIS